MASSAPHSGGAVLAGAGFLGANSPIVQQPIPPDTPATCLSLRMLVMMIGIVFSAKVVACGGVGGPAHQAAPQRIRQDAGRLETLQRRKFASHACYMTCPRRLQRLLRRFARSAHR